MNKAVTASRLVQKKISDWLAKSGTGNAPCFFSGAVETCEGCQRPLSEEKYMLDCALPGAGGTWGCLCVFCAVKDGIKPRWGSAQLYARVGDMAAPWLLVAGSPDADVVAE